MKGTYFFVAALICFAPVAATAQDTPCVEEILLPIKADEVPGAYGSVWQSFLTITNHGDTSITIGGIFGGCGLALCPEVVIDAGSTAIPRVHDNYLTLDCETASQVDITLRVRDLSRTLDTWGTTIPVVRAPNVRHGEVVSITDIPNTSGIRSMLRIYAVEEGTMGDARVRVFEVLPNRRENDRNHDQLLADFIVALQPSALDPRNTPGLAQVPLWMLPEVQGAELIRVEVSGAADLGLWAMVSATSNSTQFVTILAPDTR